MVSVWVPGTTPVGLPPLVESGEAVQRSPRRHSSFLGRGLSFLSCSVSLVRERQRPSGCLASELIRPETRQRRRERPSRRRVWCIVLYCHFSVAQTGTIPDEGSSGREKGPRWEPGRPEGLISRAGEGSVSPPES